MSILDNIRETALVPFGYAPGDYMARCSDCAEKFVGAKRCVRCASCAKERAIKLAVDSAEVKFITDVEAASAARVVYLLAEVERIEGDLRDCQDSRVEEAEYAE